MLSLLVLGIYLLLSGDGERAEWNRFLHGGSVKDEGDNYDVSILTSMTWRFLFPNGDINGEMMSPPSNNFFRSLLHFIVVRSGHDEGLGRISFRSVFLILRWQKEKRRKFLNSAYMNVGRRSLGMCSQAFCRLFVCAVIHTAKRRTSLVLRYGAIHSVGTI
jgi:hypothetical protein